MVRLQRSHVVEFLPSYLTNFIIQSSTGNASSAMSAMRTEALHVLRRVLRQKTVQQLLKGHPPLILQVGEALVLHLLAANSSVAAGLDLRSKYLGERILKRLLDNGPISQALGSNGNNVRAIRDYYQRLCDMQRQSIGGAGDDSDVEMDEDELVVERGEE